MLFNTVDPGLKVAGVTRRGESKCFETRGPLIETFRGDDTEAFSSGLFFVFFLCLFVFSSFPGVMRGLAPSLSVPSCLKSLIRHPHHLSFPKSFIGNPHALKTLMDPGLKIAGVTTRWESKGFKYCGPLIEPFRGDGTRCHCEFVVSLTWQSRAFYSI